ncbi:MAG: 4-hydroxythreonine-4-phosphate dehydrogenase PdxA [Nitrospirae bacterium]|nr:4-hydroxythreonine-4-phosphate dehydrogenase PdxA [Nitrospirota bacterium]
MQTLKKIAITMGDPGGIGPEIIVKAIASDVVRGFCIPIVIGSRIVMEEALALLSSPLRLNVINAPEEAEYSAEYVTLIEAGDLHSFEKARATADNGKACAACIRMAVDLALEKKVDGIVTAPISKEALKMAGLSWPGHTEMLAELTGAKDYAMMLTGGPLKVILVTIHTSIKSVPDMISRRSVLKTIRLAKKAGNMMAMEKPRIAVAGLNPHAGEAGIFGDEEIREIIPAIEEAIKEGIPVAGPFPPDTIFHKAYKGEFDIIVCMYHDQGLIPLKMISFDKGVNMTIGLPVIRTSPDHGTAYDIAWKGIANPSSLIEAVRLASKLRS